jgi:hypothetical protein
MGRAFRRLSEDPAGEKEDGLVCLLCLAPFARSGQMAVDFAVGSRGMRHLRGVRYQVGEDRHFGGSRGSPT